MTKRDVLSIGLRLVGVVTLAHLLIGLPGVIGAVYWTLGNNVSNAPAGIVVYIAAEVLHLALALVLVFFADSISAKLIREDRDVQMPDIQGSEKPLFRLAMRVFGVVLLVNGIPSFVKIIASLQIKLSRGGPGGTSLDFSSVSFDWLGLIWLLLMPAIGIYLVSGAKHLVKLLYGSDAPKTAAEDTV